MNDPSAPRDLVAKLHGFSSYAQMSYSREQDCRWLRLLLWPLLSQIISFL